MLLKAQVNHIKNPSHESWFYQTDSKEISIGGSLVTQRFPLKGEMSNSKCQTLFLILSGEGVISIDGILHKVIKGDAVWVDLNQKYFLDVKKGQELKIWIVNNPPFGLEQSQIHE